ncbi:uncharacterized protein LOC121235520 isoform X2 [Juglans microcarpa x Juglans regia]|uniref:uncharacterized protein LOC121235520 isoform X2 n=1 Tax=Juglans microcarpa x Juglans regia TaxID=2249226 RepID=UPI001B7F7616|nr:uncharacterized protein LOC121235520 isoform X2 [Juglans microcarpa x Juglans regia]
MEDMAMVKGIRGQEGQEGMVLEGDIKMGMGMVLKEKGIMEEAPAMKGVDIVRISTAMVEEEGMKVVVMVMAVGMAPIKDIRSASSSRKLIANVYV